MRPAAAGGPAARARRRARPGRGLRHARLGTLRRQEEPGGRPPPATAEPAAGESKAAANPAPAAAPTNRLSLDDDSVSDRVVAVVNNDAITLMEVQESIVAAKQENRGGLPSDDELAKEFLTRLIDMRLQLQEADREKIIVEEVEVDEELAARLKSFPGTPTRQQFEEALKAQGMSLDAVKRRIRGGTPRWPRSCAARSPCGSASTTRRSPSTWSRTAASSSRACPTMRATS